MKLKLFNKDFEVADHHCNFNDHAAQKIKVPYVNLYVRITDVCNANCGFCEFHDKDNAPFDKYKFLYTFTRLSKDIKINKVSFTGGEPTIYIDLLNELLKEIKEINPEVFTIVNTNGFNFMNIDTKYVDSIALSRHQIENCHNNDVFGLEPFGIWGSSNAEINKFEPKSKLHLSCNLIKGYIDSNEKCSEYINFYGNMGITDIGFVSLMGVNQYAQEHQIDFDEVDLGSMPNTIKAMTWSKKCGDKPTCKCANFLTYTDNGNIVKSYARFYADRTACKGMLVYEPNGRLTAGFNGELIC